MKDPRVFKPADRILYGGLGVYFLAYLVWVAIARGALFDSAFLMMFGLPVFALVVFVVWQCSKKSRRFSLLGNLIGALFIAGAPGLIFLLAVAANL